MDIVLVTIIGPGSSPPTTQIPIASTDFFLDLRAALLDSPAFAIFTSYHFAFQGESCSDYDQVRCNLRNLHYHLLGF